MTMHRNSAPAREATPQATPTRIEVLVDLICRPGDEPETKSAALLVLLSAIEKSTEPTIANTAKHLAFAHCGELTFDEMVNAQITTIEAELFAGDTPIS